MVPFTMILSIQSEIISLSTWKVLKLDIRNSRLSTFLQSIWISDKYYLRTKFKPFTWKDKVFNCKKWSMMGIPRVIWWWEFISNTVSCVRLCLSASNLTVCTYVLCWCQRSRHYQINKCLIFKKIRYSNCNYSKISLS